MLRRVCQHERDGLDNQIPTSRDGSFVSESDQACQDSESAPAIKLIVLCSRVQVSRPCIHQCGQAFVTLAVLIPFPRCAICLFPEGINLFFSFVVVLFWYLL